ncbi:MAG: hypothetical protein ACOYU7_01935 [Bacillota bacterium]
MRLIAIMPRIEQVGFLVDSLRNAGFDRKDMVITDMSSAETGDVRAGEDLAYLKTEQDHTWGKEPWARQLLDEHHGAGIAVAVEMSKHDAPEVREIMEQSGARKILEE